MLDFAVNVIVVVYVLAFSFVLLHSISDAHLIYHYLISFKKKKKKPVIAHDQPYVTIQLPVYNELYVVERLIDTVAAIDYPAEKLEIQVLDDSTDKTIDVIAEKVSCLQQRNINIKQIRRTNREGFKAGALKHGLEMAKGELIAIFDADFLPPKDFLHNTVPHFADESIGMVQTKWGHINKNASLLTRLQAMALDGHFSIEQTGRNDAGFFINFNGTGGVWRKKCIIDAGNWQADTLTEDLDLSYRAQLKGWKFIYLEDVTTPAELPPLISAFKSQQYRWAKGGAETARKNLKKVLTSHLPFTVKWHGLFHLIYSFGFVSIITCVILSVPVIIIKEYFPQYSSFFKAGSILYACFFIYILHYFISYIKNTTGSFAQNLVGFLIRFPLFVSLFIGISLGNSFGIMQGYMGMKSAFIRTPKFNSDSTQNKFLPNQYAYITITWLTITEGLLAIYFLFGVAIAVHFNNFSIIPMFIMAIIGFSMVFIWSLQERNKTMKRAA